MISVHVVIELEKLQQKTGKRFYKWIQYFIFFPKWNRNMKQNMTILEIEKNDQIQRPDKKLLVHCNSFPPKEDKMIDIKW